MSSGHDLTTIKPKTTSLYLSRNSRSNSGSYFLRPKCFQPKTSKSPCIRLGNEKGQKKVSANEPKWTQDPSKHQHWPFQTTLPSTKTIGDPSRGLWPSLRKSQIWSFLECGNRTLRRLPTTQSSNEWFKLFCTVIWHYSRPFLPKTTSLDLSRNSRTNPVPWMNPPKCSEPKTSNRHAYA